MGQSQQSGRLKKNYYSSNNQYKKTQSRNPSISASSPISTTINHQPNPLNQSDPIKSPSSSTNSTQSTFTKYVFKYDQS
jgi:hypothetical protein